MSRRPGDERLARRPEFWLYAISVAAGGGLLLQIVAHETSRPPAHHGVGSPTRAGTHDIGSWLADWRHWTFMVLAMMLPIVAPYARRIALQSLWRRRRRAITSFVLGYLVVWMGIGAVVAALLAAIGQTRAWPVAPIALLGAAAWQVSRPRRRVLRRCGSLPSRAIVGWRADRDCAAAGLRIGFRCLFICGPAMVAMALSQSMVVMGGVFALLLSERARGPNPDRRAGRPREAWALAACAVAAVAIS